MRYRIKEGRGAPGSFTLLDGRVVTQGQAQDFDPLKTWGPGWENVFVEDEPAKKGK